jgi:hypothetical protein
MKAKLCVLGAVLGTMPGLLPLVPMLWATPVQPRREESRSEAPRQAGPSLGGVEAEALPREQVPTDVELDEAKHPCELVTVLKVPCDPASATCEYTYWECSQQVKPLRA